MSRSIPVLRAAPRLRLPGESGDRHSTWLETFYDLVFAIVVSELGDRLARDSSPRGALLFAGLFLPVWWAWIGYSVYNTRFDTDDLVERLFTFAMMLAAAAMALQVPRAFESGSAGFAASYVGARLTLLALYARAWKAVPEARRITTGYLIGFGAGAALWLLSIFAPPPARFALWALGLLIEFATPWLIRPTLQVAPLDTSHLPERLALFTIIVLGETLLSIVTGVAQDHLRLPSLLAGALAFGVIVGLWWTYFTFDEAAPYTARLGSGQPFIYAHLPLYIAITVIGVGAGRAIADAGRLALPADATRLLGGGVLLWIASTFTLKSVSIGRLPEPVVVARYASMTAGALLFLLLGARAAPLVALTLLVAGLLIYAAFETRYWRRRALATASSG